MSDLITTNVNGRAIEPERVKAWANLNGTGTIALRGSLNISSVVDNGTGTYSYNLTSPMAAANFTTIANGHRSDIGSDSTDANVSSTKTSTVSSYRTVSVALSGVLRDFEQLNSIVMGDLA
ncbi:hypothetical protein [Curvivirga aplysinae]|uniref:hypothetical protein n=1 Tax=Curvivirga aplysinae TaxID=2529852 RepID=UPI0012BBAB12|nr:hypothetical protein [Curvivirga aplysinae]MTI10181.1 hypothetical protein [Curvivirga aplysinae]